MSISSKLEKNTSSLYGKPPILMSISRLISYQSQSVSVILVVLSHLQALRHHLKREPLGPVTGTYARANGGSLAHPNGRREDL